ncbi:MAG: helix-turn-helix domain-containing protein [Lachnospiraceae bacterium]|nr:helix-turn-helix domain-containing protein [Lachnospiraceae bacterium]
MKPDYVQIGNRIRERRRAKGYTQAVLAEKADISDTYVCYIENGQKKVSMQVLMQIAEALEVSADCLLYGDQSAGRGEYLLEFGKLLEDCSLYEKEAIYNVSCDVKEALRKLQFLIEHSG